MIERGNYEIYIYIYINNKYNLETNETTNWQFKNTKIFLHANVVEYTETQQ